MTTVLSLEDAVVTLNGKVATGWADESASIDFGVLTKTTFRFSPDGKMFGVRSGQKGGPIVFRFQPNSPMVGFLSRLFERYKNGETIRIDGTVEYAKAGISFSLNNGYFESASLAQSMGSDFTNMEYTITFEKVGANYDSNKFSSLFEVITALV